MTVSDATIDAEGFKDFFRSVGKTTVDVGKKVAKNPVRAFKRASKVEVQPQLETLELHYQPHLI